MRNQHICKSHFRMDRKRISSAIQGKKL